MSVTHFTEERCVMCGQLIEEGRQVCARCDRKIAEDSPAPRNTEDRKRTGFSLGTFLLYKEKR